MDAVERISNVNHIDDNDVGDFLVAFPLRVMIFYKRIRRKLKIINIVR